MRAVCQRVSSARVIVSDRIIGTTGHGLIVFLGIHKEDDEKSALKMADRISRLRVFDDRAGKMNLSIQDIQGEIMLISQFTLYGSTKSGNRPSFTEAAPPDQARVLYEMVRDRLAERHVVKTGVFQALMTIDARNDGPVTVILET
ncbi:MAG: D-aminoacyl-tRNA deacylase [Acholeplasmataceae bacterium]